MQKGLSKMFFLFLQPQEKHIPRPDETNTTMQKCDIKDLLAKGVSRKQIEDLILRQLSNGKSDTRRFFKDI